MTPDISYILEFELTQKDHVIRSLEKFCVNTVEGAFDVSLISPDCTVSFVVDQE